MRRINMLHKLAGIMMLAFFFTTQSYAQALTAENQVISLRHIIEQTSDMQQRKAALQLMASAGTYQALTFAASLLGDEQLETAKAAAGCVLQILSTHPDYNGKESREMLARAIPLLEKKQKKQAKAWLDAADKNEEGFVCLFNGKDLEGWKGLVENPISRAKMSVDELAKAQQKADELMRRDWIVENGDLLYIGHGWDNICTVKQYGDFELLVDWRLDPNGKEPDAGVYLRGAPQVQIWDIRRTDVGAQVGSGGLYNNQKNPSTPTSVEDNKLGEWNTFRIIMKGEKVTVWLNGTKVVDDVVLENYWDRKQPIFPREQIEMQAHGSRCYFRNIYVREIKN
ncbi:MAG: DUF1080 domain-containing protein [Bacteroidaceae bacterium]|nr:DUF1080 domain-containing protein [Bacteroidaceae bacterium]MBQ9294112.1 DUF1080 domain-containing protein [Bacteroidaceae bacterium]